MASKVLRLVGQMDEELREFADVLDAIENAARNMGKVL